jgi:predicted heme/steroid binding protein
LFKMQSPVLFTRHSRFMTVYGVVLLLLLISGSPAVLVRRTLAKGRAGKKNGRAGRKSCSSKLPSSGSSLTSRDGTSGYYVAGKTSGGKFKKLKNVDSVASCFESCVQSGCGTFVYSASRRRCKLLKGSVAGSGVRYCTDAASKKNDVVGVIDKVAGAVTELQPGPTPGSTGSTGSTNASGGGKKYTMADVGQHAREGDCWVAVGGEVYDITSFGGDHPGGRVIFRECGRDATRVLNQKHSSRDRAFLVNTIGAIGALEGGSTTDMVGGTVGGGGYGGGYGDDTDGEESDDEFESDRGEDTDGEESDDD